MKSDYYLIVYLQSTAFWRHTPSGACQKRIRPHFVSSFHTRH